MTLQPSRATLRRTAWAGVALTLTLIVLGGVVRITGSGMGCGDHWPRCNGEWFPPLDLPTFIEIFHRWVAALVSVLVVAAAWIALRRHRKAPLLWRPAVLALVLLISQVVFGAITVKLELPAWIVIVHLVNAMLLLAAVTVTALRSTGGGSPLERSRRHGYHGLVVATTALSLVTLLVGAQVANLNAAFLCLGFPLCHGTLLPPPNTLGALHWVHRILAYTLLAMAIAIWWKVRRYPGAPGRQISTAAGTALGFVALQIVIAAVMVLQLFPDEWRVAHVLGGSLVWLGMIVLTYVSARTPRPSAMPAHRATPSDEPHRGKASPEPASATLASTSHPLWRDLIALTKPRVISLLLLTAVVPMFVTDLGLPSPGLVWWVLLGGYLMAGGANAINMWFDQDIDNQMVRTRLRPVPSGRLSPNTALWFGIFLGVVAFAALWRFTTPLAAWLALAGLLFYVFVYTIGLKRTSRHNIVIGGAAGAFPPLVGYTAVTGRLDLPAMYLFLIIFFWTPPHFWALALIKKEEYARAGVPMLPVVAGDRHTKIQMVLYTLLLLPLTLTPSLFGAFGIFYAMAAVLLWARFLWYAVSLLRSASVTPLAWRMYRFSLLYLALLFLAMGVDRNIPWGHPVTPEIMLLNSDDTTSTLPATHGVPAP
jgi:protoheme IX farnesyltransferase